MKDIFYAPFNILGMYPNFNLRPQIINDWSNSLYTKKNRTCASPWFICEIKYNRPPTGSKRHFNAIRRRIIITGWLVNTSRLNTRAPIQFLGSTFIGTACGNWRRRWTAGEDGN
jgi:hypothetical protein